MSRAVIHETFGGPDVLEVREVPEPHAGPGEVRIRVAAVGLNPMDGGIALFPEIAARFGITLPAGFGCDFAGIVDEVGGGVSGVSVGERVFGGAIAKAAAEYIVLAMPHDVLLHTPDGISDEVASTVPVAGLTAVAALDAIGLHAGDTVLIGGAAGGVGVFAVQLARLIGARVIGTASEGTFDFLRSLGAEPVAYGAGLVDRVGALAPGPRSTPQNRPYVDGSKPANGVGASRRVGDYRMRSSDGKLRWVVRATGREKSACVRA